jgi:hypothetical protein
VDLKLEYLIKVSNGDVKGNPVYFLFEDPSSQGQFLNTLPALPYDMDVLLSHGIEYVTINGIIKDPAKDIFLRELNSKGNIVAEFGPYWDGVFKQTPDPMATTHMTVKDEDIFSRVLQGPSIRIYRINSER